MRNFGWLLLWVLGACGAAGQTIITVNTAGDTLASGTGVQSGGNYDLRGAVNFINSQSGTGTYVIDFSLGSSNTISLGASLQPLNAVGANTITINGSNGGSSVVIDGQNASRIFFAYQGTVTIENMTLQNANAKGGDGASGGGGGLGAGGAIFVGSNTTATTAAVTVSNVNFSHNQATGGPAPRPERRKA